MVVMHWVAPSGGVLHLLTIPEVCIHAALTSALKLPLFTFCGAANQCLGLISESKMRTYSLPFHQVAYRDVITLIARGSLSGIVIAIVVISRPWTFVVVTCIRHT